MPDSDTSAYRSTARDGIVAAVVILLAVGAWWLLRPPVPVFNVPSRFQQAQPNYQPGGQACRPDELARITSPRKHQLRADECADKWEQYREAIKNADEAARAAEATEQAAYQAYRQAETAALTAAILILALGASGWAAFAAFDAASAGHLSVKKADETLTHARESAEQQLRAYVFPVRAESVIDVKEPLQIHILRSTRLRIINSGNTPARMVRTSINTIGCVGELPKDFDFPDGTEGGDKTHPLGPGQESFINIDHDPDMVIEFLKQNKRIYIWGWVEYFDAFKNTPLRRTEMAFEITQAHVSADHVYVPLDAFNGYDEGCYRQP